MLACRELTTKANKDDQHNKTSVNHVPEGPLAPFPPPKEPVKRTNVPQSFELEREQRLVMSSKDKCTDDNETLQSKIVVQLVLPTCTNDCRSGTI